MHTPTSLFHLKYWLSVNWKWRKYALFHPKPSIFFPAKLWLPLEYPWKHPWENLLNAEQLVTTGIHLETPLGKLIKC
jgi:hypothetical protein